MLSLKAVRRAGVPLVVVETSDPQQSIALITGELNGKAQEIPLMRWDIVRALVGLNEAGKRVVRDIAPEAIMTQNPTECLSLLTKAPSRSIIFFMMAHRYWNVESVAQAIWNLRDTFKTSGALLVLLAPSSASLPADLASDCVVITDTLPTREEVGQVLDAIVDDAVKQNVLPEAPKGKERERIMDTLAGLSAFSAEQVVAMSISKEGVNLDNCWNTKRKMIEQTKGLSVWRGGEKFEDIGGYENVKKFVRAICTGNDRPNGIVFIDEIEKSMGGTGDTTGISQDYLRSVLTFMQDKEAVGMIFVGAPGSGKSAVAKAAGNEAGIPTISLDLGGMKGSLVGQSEEALRTALQVVDAVTQGKALFIATCNSIANLPPELRRRFSLGTFYFPLPTATERMKIWDIYTKRFKLNGIGSGKNSIPADEGWTGAEIKNCCMVAYRMDTTLAEAAKFIVPVAVAARDKILALEAEADGRYISAGVPGIYRKEDDVRLGQDAKRKLTS